MNQQQQPMYVPQMKSIAERVNNKPRLVQCIQAHNEEEFIGLTLASIYDEVDKILVIEGAVQNRPDSTDDGHSTDKTVEIIEDFKANHDPEKKVTFLKIRRHWKNLEEMKQTFLDMCMPGDWIIINDADEFYKPEDIARLRLAIDLNPHACEFVPLFLHFYKDFHHVAVPGPEWQPQHQRIFKYTEGMKYNSHPIVTDAAGRCTYFSPEYQPRRVMLNDFFIYHYGYARANMDEVMKKKQDYYKGELAKHDGADKKFDKKVEDWFDMTEPVLGFTGDHPEIMTHHPMSAVVFFTNDGKVEMPKNWDTVEPYRSALAGEDYGNIWLCMTKQSQPHMHQYHNGMEILIASSNA
jgi:glycosyltransferase involved in cell wall biosynthesis